MQLFVTRTQPEASATVAKLVRLGFDVLATPLMDVEFLKPKQALQITLDTAFVFTSANGVRALLATMGSDIGKYNARVCFCIGSATADVVYQAGFKNVITGDGNVVELGQIICKSLDKNNTIKHIIHPCATKLAGDLSIILNECGISYTKFNIYQTNPLQQLPLVLKKALQETQEKPCGLLVYSPRSAILLEKLIKCGDFDMQPNHDVYTLSQNVTQILELNHWRSIVTAPKPNESALIKLLVNNINA